MARPQTYSAGTRETVRLLAAEIARARRSRRWTMTELGDRVGISNATVSKIERGDLGVAIGTVFEVASVVGIDLIAPPGELDARLARSRERLALLPSRVRSRSGEVDDDF